MKSVQDALYNWLTIKAVVDARPEDTAAIETEEMFSDILKNQHGVTDIEINRDESMYQVSFKQNGESKSTRFPTELIEVLLNQIKLEPEKYENYPDE
jgi:hypothetical protein